jgi:hypothetical protein
MPEALFQGPSKGGEEQIIADPKISRSGPPKGNEDRSEKEEKSNARKEKNTVQ